MAPLRRLIGSFTQGVPPRREFGPGTRGLLRYLAEIVSVQPPGLARLMTLQPLMSFGTSILCIVLLRKGFEYAPVVIATVLFAIFYLTFRLQIHRRGGVMPKVWDMALLFMINDMLIFVIPFYLESMTIPSRQLLFAPIPLALAVISHWFRLYQRFVLPYPVLGSLFYSLTIFCVLNLVFPVIFGMQNLWSLLLSGAIASVTVLLFINPHIPLLRGGKNILLSLAGIAFFLCILWFGRSVIPPAPLRLVHATACEAVTGLTPVNPFLARSGTGLDEVYFFSSILAPRGLRERVFHVWRRGGRRLFAVDLRDIRGGRKEGFRTWSRHRLAGERGDFTVEVWTAGGQLVGQRDFSIR
ncbi:MAG: DUF2914 domain-containing protein [Spirochaetes bacterium]|nr:DUF2914 domain-containing protein [Spirochaetota bacterium]